MTSRKSPTLSICLGTLNRRAYLQRAIETARESAGALTCEFVIVDGGSTDGTLEWLRECFRIGQVQTLVEHGSRMGAVRAFNDAFAAAKGEFVAALNDDTACVGPLLSEAVAMLRADKGIGQIALPYGKEGETPHYELVYIPALGGKVLYANFSVMRRQLGKKLDWWGRDSYVTYGGDTELSVKVWMQGLRVAPLRTYAPGQVLKPTDPRLIHYLANDATRVPNVEQDAFNAKWRKPLAGQDAVALIQARNAVAAANAVSLLEKVRQMQVPAFPRHMREAVLVKYMGEGSGSIPWHPTKSKFKYLVSALEPLVWVDISDLNWMLAQTRGRTQLFTRVEVEDSDEKTAHE